MSSLPPQGQPGDEGAAVLPRQPLEPPRPQVGGDPGGEPPGDLPGQQGLVRLPPLQQDGHGEARAPGVQIVPVGDLLQKGNPPLPVQKVVAEL